MDLRTIKGLAVLEESMLTQFLAMIRCDDHDGAIDTPRRRNVSNNPQSLVQVREAVVIRIVNEFPVVRAQLGLVDRLPESDQDVEVSQVRGPGPNRNGMPCGGT